MKVARLSALSTGRLYPQGRSLVLICVIGRVFPTAIVRLKGLNQKKNLKYLIGNRTRDLPDFSAVLQTPALPRTTEDF
jgi:hypothetical protein